MGEQVLSLIPFAVIWVASSVLAHQKVLVHLFGNGAANESLCAGYTTTVCVPATMDRLYSFNFSNRKKCALQGIVPNGFLKNCGTEINSAPQKNYM